MSVNKTFITKLRYSQPSYDFVVRVSLFSAHESKSTTPRDPFFDVKFSFIQEALSINKCSQLYLSVKESSKGTIK